MKLKWRCVIRATLMQLFFCPRRWWWKRFVCHFYALVYMGSISSIVPEVLNANWSSWPCLVRNGTRLAILWFAASSNGKSESCGFLKGRLQGYWAFVPLIRGFSGSCLQNGPISWGPTSSGIHFMMGQIGVSCGQWRLPIPRHVSLQNLEPHFTITVVCAHADYPLEEAKWDEMGVVRRSPCTHQWQCTYQFDTSGRYKDYW